MPTQALSSAKWKEAGKAGFQLLPDVLLKKQSALELSATDLVVLINVTMHWWYAEQRPFPRASVIASRMGVEPRTVQRSMKRLTELGLLRKEIENKGTEREREVCDLSGLVDRLDRLAQTDPDYLARTHAKETAREAAL
ncbi:helix-turn-helix domain-containing protein [Mesorhizobium sp.]|uniref:helix-turn-helix domain-containing protein n=1 Tax=Mesorhizobium sp. TaxID=1871066 RepID=UPI0025F91532|nr:helix-turn-helix domain-containing protein [Mesorhizobium sp.]